MSDEAKSWDELGGLDDAVDGDNDSSFETTEESPVLAERKIRDLHKRDLQVIKQLVSEYPNFRGLPVGDQLDRVILVLETVCGFGAISEQTIQQFEMILKFPAEMVQPHLRAATYSHGGAVKRRYREPFAGAYCLEREYKKILASEGSRSNQDEPIRKKVAIKREVVDQPVSNSRPAPVRTAPRPSAPAKPLSLDPLSSDQKVIKPELLSTTSVDNISQAQPIESSTRRYAIIVAGVILAVVTVGLFFIIR